MALTKRIARMQQAMAGFMRFYETQPWLTEPDPEAADFVFGNPHERPLPGFVQALKTWSEPQNKDWFAYKLSEAPAREAVAASLARRGGPRILAEDVLMTDGGFAAIAVALAALLEPGDEVLFLSPPWFFYELLIVAQGGQPVRVDIDRATYDLDVPAIAAAVTERTRAIIVNSPNNPTGKIYPPETLAALSEVLTQASLEHGRPIFLLSDEAYSRIVYDGRRFPSPVGFYPYSLLLYTYGKTLLTPGQRLGYIALPEAMPDRASVRDALFTAQLATGYAFPNALLQHALGDLERLSIDTAHLQAKRDRMVAALRNFGYGLHVPEGTFYLLVESPDPDDLAFATQLAGQGVYVLPGSVVELPGTFRVSLTANDAMIERSLPVFRAAHRALRH